MLSLNIGATGMLAQQLNVDVISNNLANMTTTGYKHSTTTCGVAAGTVGSHH